MLERMYVRWGEKQGHRTRFIDRQQGEQRVGPDEGILLWQQRQQQPAASRSVLCKAGSRSVLQGCEPQLSACLPAC
jgi:hypothetical protein